jgi:hypothetical protein
MNGEKKENVVDKKAEKVHKLWDKITKTKELKPLIDLRSNLADLSSKRDRNKRLMDKTTENYQYLGKSIKEFIHLQRN